LLILFLLGLDAAFFQYMLTLFLLVLANLLGIILPRISLSGEVRALYSLIYSPSLPFTSFTHIKKKTLLSSVKDWKDLMTSACGREQDYFLQSWCLFFFSRSSNWPFVNRNCLLVESINKVLALNLRYPWLSHGGCWNYFFMVSGRGETWCVWEVKMNRKLF